MGQPGLTPRHMALHAPPKTLRAGRSVAQAMPTKEVTALSDTNTNQARQTRLAHDVRKEELLRAVIDVCAQEGISKLSVSNITKHVGCTRSLFYHYFPNKEAALEAALDYTIDAFIDRLRTWNANRTRGDIEGALDTISALLRSMVLQTPDLPKSIAIGGDAILYTDFVHRVAERCARYICDSTVVEFQRYHEVLIDHVFETFYVLISGLIMFIRSHPYTSTEVIKDIIASTLHIEGFTAKYASRNPECPATA